MISCSCDVEGYNHYFQRHHKARKDHQCDDCGGKITAGESYMVHGGMFDRHWDTFKQCADCDFMKAEVGRSLFAHCGGWSCVYAGDMPQSWEDIFDGLAPVDITDEEAAHVRRIVGMQHAVCKARGGDRLWVMPDIAVYGWCHECGEDIARGSVPPLCGECLKEQEASQ